ncbi:MAG: arylsulfatase [Rickettsiales bacterium]|nr:arylsulfatase [Rickettsiales bacterium]
MKYLSILSLLITGLVSCNQTRENATISKPNIIYILADDLGYGDLSCYGQQNFQTPNIDRLAQQGMLFTQHYSGSTVCAPSRSALLTGLHTGHTPIRGNYEIRPEGQFPMADSVVTFPEILQNNGYITGAFGKWGLGYPGSEGDPNNQGFNEFYGYNCQRLAHNYFPAHLWHNEQKVVLDKNDSNQFVSYAPALIHDEAIRFLESNKDTTFFMYYASALPHAELLVPEEDLLPFRDKYLPEKPHKGAEYGDNGFRNGSYGSQPESHAAFAAMVTILDKQVGELMDKLDKLGLTDNTIIIFTSDNGPHLEGGADPDYFDSNGVLKGYKRDMYEGGIRVPFIAKWPNHIAPGSKSEHISAFWDFYPTVMDLIGDDSEQSIDGLSYLPALLGQEDQPVHDYLYWEYNKSKNQALRVGDWKAIKFIGDRTELYNLKNDPNEQENVAEKYPEIMDEMERLFEQAHQDNPDFPLNL